MLSLIVTRAPLRVSIFGGGTDFYEFHKNKKSKILTFTINKYIYVILKKREDKLIYLNYSKKEILKNIKYAKHDIIREVFKNFKIFNGIELSILSDIPSKGSGLGSSSALTNALILACSRYKKINLTQKKIAKKAIEIEINKLKKPIGIQDQYGTAIGGIKILEMYKKKVTIKKIKNNLIKNIFENKSVIYDTRKNRRAEEILLNQKKNIEINQSYLNEIRLISNDFFKKINNFDITYLIEKLNLSWKIKKRLDKRITNNSIEKKIYKLKKMDFSGFKLCGAGKGGFIFALSKKNIKTKKFLDSNLKKILVDNDGVKILYEKNL